MIPENSLEATWVGSAYASGASPTSVRHSAPAACAPFGSLEGCQFIELCKGDNPLGLWCVSDTKGKAQSVGALVKQVEHR